jgi:predicted regulator of Ras-like GTPase activity (Roadblock/LC7/MglB family)
LLTATSYGISIWILGNINRKLPDATGKRVLSKTGLLIAAFLVGLGIRLAVLGAMAAA